MKLCPRCQSPLTEIHTSGLCAACMLTHAFQLPPAEAPVDLFDEGEGGEVFGRFVLLEELGRGGMGVVYRVRERLSGRVVALKMILPSQVHAPIVLGQFTSEVRVAARLDHPHILPIYEMSEQDGLPFFSMRFAEGGNLAQHMGKFQGRPRETAALVHKLALAMHHAHQRGVVHRDLKPGNVLLDAAGEPMVGDFGIAKVLSAEADPAQTMMLLGTPSYAAPEILLKGNEAVTTAVDIYGLGAIFYELLTGAPPYVAPTAGAILQQMQQSPVDGLPGRAAIADRELEAIVLKCLAPEPAGRYESALALAQDLERWREGYPILARPVGWTGRAARWSRRNPALAGLTGIVIALVVIGVTAAVFATMRIARERDHATEESRHVLAAEREARERLRDSYLSQAKALRVTGLAGQRFGALAALHAAAQIRPGLDLRNEAIASLALYDLKLETEVSRGGEPRPVAFDATLTRFLVSEGEHGDVVLRGADDHRELARFAGPGSPVVFFTPLTADGRYFAARYADRLRIWDAKEKRLVIERAPLPSGSVQPMLLYDCAFDEADRRVAFGLLDGGVEIVSLETGITFAKWPLPVRPALLAFSSDGKSLAWFGPRSGTVHVMNPSDGTERRAFTLPADVQHLAWSPDGRVFAVSALDQKIHLMVASTGQESRTLAGPTQDVFQLAWHPAGRLLAAAAGDRVLRLWDVQTGDVPVVAWPARGAEPMLRFSIDGSHLVAGEWAQNLHRLKVAASPVCRIVPTAQVHDRAGLYAALDFSPDGRWLVTSSYAAVRLWDREKGTVIFTLPLDPGVEKAALFSADGASLLVSSRLSGLRRYRLDWPEGKMQSPVLVADEQLDQTKTLLLQSLDARRQTAALSRFTGTGVRLVPLTGGQSAWERLKEPEAWSVEASADGRWVGLQYFGMGASRGFGARVIERATDRQVAELAVGPGGSVAFSPDSRWFVASGSDGVQLRDTHDWSRVVPLPEGFDASFMRFSPDGKILAGTGERGVQLVDLEHGEILGVLEAPQLMGTSARLAFSPDGATLCAMGGDGTLFMWDLRAVRAGLAEIGLDWTAP